MANLYKYSNFRGYSRETLRLVHTSVAIVTVVVSNIKTQCESKIIAITLKTVIAIMTVMSLT